jgi:hypothetical protein
MATFVVASPAAGAPLFTGVTMYASFSLSDHSTISRLHLRDGADMFALQNDDSISVPSGYLATFAQDLRKYCTKGCNLGRTRYCRTGGQEFEEEEGYNIIVNLERC